MNRSLDVPCKLYFDIDVDTRKNPGKSYPEMVDHLINLINTEARIAFNINSTKTDVIILDASYPIKFSNHLIFNKIIFREGVSPNFVQSIWIGVLGS